MMMTTMTVVVGEDAVVEEHAEQNGWILRWRAEHARVVVVVDDGEVAGEKMLRSLHHVPLGELDFSAMKMKMKQKWRYEAGVRGPPENRRTQQRTEYEAGGHSRPRTKAR